MDQIDVTSSNVESIFYDGDDLYVRFKSRGQWYCYIGVTEVEVFDMQEAESKGRFINDVIKASHVCQKIEDPEAIGLPTS